MFWVKRETTGVDEQEKEELIFSEENCMLLTYMVTQVDKYQTEIIQAEIESSEPKIPSDLKRKSAEELASELMLSPERLERDLKTLNFSPP